MHWHYDLRGWSLAGRDLMPHLELPHLSLALPPSHLQPGCPVSRSALVGWTDEERHYLGVTASLLWDTQRKPTVTQPRSLWSYRGARIPCKSVQTLGSEPAILSAPDSENEDL